jgi:hypothetical protein
VRVGRGHVQELSATGKHLIGHSGLCWRAQHISHPGCQGTAIVAVSRVDCTAFSVTHCTDGRSARGCCPTAGLPHNDIAAQICRQAGLVKHPDGSKGHGTADLLGVEDGQVGLLLGWQLGQEVSWVERSIFGVLGVCGGQLGAGNMAQQTCWGWRMAR